MELSIKAVYWYSHFLETVNLTRIQNSLMIHKEKTKEINI